MISEQSSGMDHHRFTFTCECFRDNISFQWRNVRHLFLWYAHNELCHTFWLSNSNWKVMSMHCDKIIYCTFISACAFCLPGSRQQHRNQDSYGAYNNLFIFPTISRRAMNCKLTMFSPVSAVPHLVLGSTNTHERMCWKLINIKWGSVNNEIIWVFVPFQQCWWWLYFNTKVETPTIGSLNDF